MTTDQIVTVIYIVLATAVVLLPVRWALVAYILLSTVDFRTTGNHVDILNALKALALPLYLLWRLRKYSGHRRVILAPIAWVLLAIYAGIASSWSFYPLLSFKLIGHMMGSLVICCVFLRASKGPELQPSLVVPVTIGVICIAALRSIFAPHYADEAARFTTFSTAQAFAALLVALYCIALCSKALHPAARICMCCLLPAVLVLDGSRIWAFGLLMSSVLALVISNIRTWVKLCALGLVIVIAATVIGGSDTIVRFLSRHAQSNRIAAAITAAYIGDTNSAGLGTLRFRKGLTAEVVDQLDKSSLTELLTGHGTCNGPLMGGSITKGLDPNRFFHNEWLRVIYEWGVIGLLLFVLFLGSMVAFAIIGFRKDAYGYARPLLVYLPAFLVGLTGENMIAGAGNAVSVGFLLTIGFAGISHRPSRRRIQSGEILRADIGSLPAGTLPQQHWAAPLA